MCVCVCQTQVCINVSVITEYVRILYAANVAADAAVCLSNWKLARVRVASC